MPVWSVAVAVTVISPVVKADDKSKLSVEVNVAVLLSVVSLPDRVKVSSLEPCLSFNETVFIPLESLASTWNFTNFSFIPPIFLPLSQEYEFILSALLLLPVAIFMLLTTGDVQSDVYSIFFVLSSTFPVLIFIRGFF